MCAYVFGNSAAFEKTSELLRVAHVLLLRSVASYRGSEYACVQALRVDRKRGDCSKAPRNPQKVNLCVPASSSCREMIGSAGRQGQLAALG